jgi:nitrogen regulatory protein P-II 1
MYGLRIAATARASRKEALHHDRRARQLLREHLDGDALADVDVLGLVDGPCRHAPISRVMRYFPARTVPTGIFVLFGHAIGGGPGCGRAVRYSTWSRPSTAAERTTASARAEAANLPKPDLRETRPETGAAGLPLHDPWSSPREAMKKVEAIIKPFKLDEVKDALAEVGIQGMTVTEVKGFGRTGGKKEVYRGSAYVVDFVPKVKVEIVVPDAHGRQTSSTRSRAPPRRAASATGRSSCTPVDEAVRIRTGERGEDAI